MASLNVFLNLPGAVKAVAVSGEYDAELVLDVLGAPYGVDRSGQEFYEGTDFGSFDVVPVVYFHGFGQPSYEWIGKATKSKRDHQGQWYRVVLDGAKALARKIYESAKKGLARASSDSISHLVRPGVNVKGRVTRWPIAALSLMDMDNYENAINMRAIAIPAVRADFENRVASWQRQIDATQTAQVAQASADASIRVTVEQAVADSLRKAAEQRRVPMSPAPKPAHGIDVSAVKSQRLARLVRDTWSRIPDQDRAAIEVLHGGGVRFSDVGEIGSFAVADRHGIDLNAGLLAVKSDVFVRGVIGHELAHVRNGDAEWLRRKKLSPREVERAEESAWLQSFGWGLDA